MNVPEKKNAKLQLAGTLAFVFALAIFLRFWGIAARPMHTDEAVQAFRVGVMLLGDGFRYIFTDFHGPTLYFFTFWLCKLCGIESFAEMTETLVRSVPAIVGALGCVSIPLAFFGRKTLSVFIAGTFFATSAVMIFYAGYFIQETLLAVFAWTAAGIFFFRAKTLLNALLAGTFFGLAIATKETWVLMLFAFAIGKLLQTASSIFLSKTPETPAKPEKSAPKRKNFRYFATVLFSAGTIAALFYSSFGAHLGGMKDFFLAFPHYFSKASVPAENLSQNVPAAENVPVFSHFSFFETFIFSDWIASIGLISIFIFGIAKLFEKPQKTLRNALKIPASLAIFLAASTVSLFAIYAIMPYKMAWFLLGIMPGGILLAVLLLAGTFLGETKKCGWKISPRCATGTFALLLGICCCFAEKKQVEQLHRYTQTSARVPEIVPVVEKAKANFIAHGGAPDAFFVAIVADEYWPLPWYLRSERVGYWSKDATLPFAHAPFLIGDFSLWENAENRAGEFTPRFEFELRTGIILDARERKIRD